MKFCPVVPEICRGQIHASQKERIRIIIIIIKIMKFGGVIDLCFFLIIKISDFW
jgi:hypothetical protein